MQISFKLVDEVRIKKGTSVSVSSDPRFLALRGTIKTKEAGEWVECMVPRRPTCRGKQYIITAVANSIILLYTTSDVK